MSCLDRVRMVTQWGEGQRDKYEVRDGGGLRQKPDQWLEQLKARWRSTALHDLRC